jgi:multiple sugar transport system permease protein
MMSPGILVLLAITVFPFLAIIFMSFNEVSPIGGLSFEFIGLENWKAMFTDPAIGSSWVVSLVYFVSALVIEMVLGVAIALLVHELVWGKNLAISLLIMPIFMAPVIVGLIGRFMVSSPYGLYAWALESSGIYTGSILGTGTSALIAVIIMDVWEWTPLITLIVLAGLSSVSQDVQEAARVDGAGYWQRLRYITAPMIAGVVVVALLIRSMDLIRYFDKILVTTNGGPADATKIIPVRLYETAFRFFELGYASAIGFSMLVFSIVVALTFVQFMRKKELLP